MSQYYVTLSYKDYKRDFSILREDAYVIPGSTDLETRKTLRFIFKKIKMEGFNGELTIKEVKNNIFKQTFEKTDLLDLVFIKIENGACIVSKWLDEYNRFSVETPMSIRKAIVLIKDTTNVGELE